MKQASRRHRERREPTPLPNWLSKASSGPLPILIIAVVGIVIYSNTLENSFHFDDKTSIETNRSIQNLSDFRAIWRYSPTRFVTYLTFALNYHFDKLDVFGYHLVNILVHLGSSILAWWLVRLTLSTPTILPLTASKHAKTLALLAGLIFVAHPVQTQAVTYIVQRATSLATLFYLCSLGLYVKGRLEQVGGAKRATWVSLLLGSFAAALLAMFTKEIALTLPFVILLCELSFFHRHGKANVLFPLLLAAFLLAIPLLLIFSDILPLAETSKISRVDYLLTQFQVGLTYTRLLILPTGLNLDYNYPVSKTLFELPTLSGFVLSVVLLAAAVGLFRKHRLTSFGMLWVFITLLPESSLIPIRDVINEHRLYLPMLGFALLFATGVHDLLRPSFPHLFAPAMLALVLLYSVSSYRRNAVWKDEVTLWTDVIEKSPANARAFNNRGDAYFQEGEYEKAVADYDSAVAGDLQSVPNPAVLYYNRGVADLRTRRYGEAVEDFGRAIALQPDYADALVNRGSVYIQVGHIDAAIADFTSAISLNPQHAEAYSNRGQAFQEKGEHEKAIADLTEAIRMTPDVASAYNNRGVAYAAKGEYEMAIADYGRALDIDPTYTQAYVNRAYAYFSMKEYEKARQDVQNAESLGYEFNPSFLELLRVLSSK